MPLYSPITTPAHPLDPATCWQCLWYGTLSQTDITSASKPIGQITRLETFYHCPECGAEVRRAVVDVAA